MTSAPDRHEMVARVDETVAAGADQAAAEARLGVIVLTRDEKAKPPDLLTSLRGLVCRVFVVDSGSSDATVAIAEAAGCAVVSYPFDNYAAKRNWAFDHLPIDTPWVLSLDADERLTPELRDEIAAVVAADDPAFSGWMLKSDAEAGC